MSYVESHMKQVMDRCFLERMSEASDKWHFESYYLKQPNTGCYRTLIIFTPREGIVLTGDLMLIEASAGGGVVSNCGYGKGWFASDLSEDYLCEKFFRTEWVPERAVDYIKDMLETDEDLTACQKNSIRDALIDETCGDSTMFHIWWDETFSYSPESIGYGYNLASAGWLCAIQQRFRELYKLFESGIEGTSSFNAKELSENTDMMFRLKDCKFYLYSKDEKPHYVEGQLMSLEEALKMSQSSPGVYLMLRRAMA